MGKEDIRTIHVTAEAAQHIAGGHVFPCVLNALAVGQYVADQIREVSSGPVGLVGIETRDDGAITVRYRERADEASTGPATARYRDGWEHIFGGDE